MNAEAKDFIISSPAFADQENIPSKYTCDGEEVNPPLRIGRIPENTQTLALIVEDPDAPGGTFDHWLLWNIDPVLSIEENSIPGISGKNSAGKTGYHGPCPPTGSHRYQFTVYALDKQLYLAPGAEKKELEEAMKRHIIATARITGRYQKTK